MLLDCTMKEMCGI